MKGDDKILPDTEEYKDKTSVGMRFFNLHTSPEFESYSKVVLYTGETDADGNSIYYEYVDDEVVAEAEFLFIIGDTLQKDKEGEE